MPACLKSLIVPPARIAEFSGLLRFHSTQRIEEVIRQVALHETGHAVAWVLNSGILERTTIVPQRYQGGVLWGLTTLDVPDEPSSEERHRLAFSGMGAPALCYLAGNPDMDATMKDFESSAQALRPIYPNPDKLSDKLIQTWIDVLKFFGTPRVWRTADAFARKLITVGTIERFPADCISKDNLPVPGLKKALRTWLGPLVPITNGHGCMHSNEEQRLAKPV